jgi:hypothetical protein
MESKVSMSWIPSGEVDGEMIGGQLGTKHFFVLSEEPNLGRFWFKSVIEKTD